MKEKLLFFSFKILLLLFMISIVEIKSQVSTNYYFSQNSGTYTALASPTVIVQSTALALWDDGVSGAISLPFDFQMNGADYNTCRVNYNGYITFGTTAPAGNNVIPISSNAGYANAISALGMDLYSGTISALNAGREISYATIGVAPNRTFVVQWKNVLRKNQDGDWNFQIRLEENSNKISFVYGACTTTSSTALNAQIGLRGANNTDFINRNLITNVAWLNNTTAGGANNSTVRTRTGALPASGTTFVWTPYCTPNFTNTDKGRLYINSFQFVGVLNATVANTSTSATGYQDFTSFAPIAEQPQGTAINIIASSASTSTPKTNGTWKAWVDWNKDGDFVDAGEEVYNMISFTTPSVTFGFIIPAGQAVGNYRLRIGTFSTQNNNFTSCSTVSGFGEMEDYTFRVVADCSAKVISVNTVNAFDGERCGAGSVRISATGNANAVNYRWYDSNYGGTLLGTGNVFNTPSISNTTTYYVTALSSGGCETPFRYPVEARIDPNPTVTFSTSDPAICGEDVPSLLVTASGDKYQDVIFEKFDSGLGVFTNEVAGAYTGSLGFWQRRDTPYIPTIADGYEGLSPAMASGYFGGGFAMINSDISRGSTGQSILNRMVSGNLDVSGYLNLKIDFDLYNFTIALDFTEGYTLIEYSLNGGSNWSTLDQFIGTRGNPLKWEKFSYTIPGTNFTSTNFKIRFTVYSFAGKLSGGSTGFVEGITAIDNIRIYGFKTINTPFNWSSGALTIYDTDCTTALGSTLKSTVCVKPTATQLENVNWDLSASATFSNGCPAIGSFTVDNDTKTWNQSGITDWNLSPQWKPVSVPTIAKCVIVRTPVELPSLTTGTQGLARSVIVKSGGKLNISPKSSLTIQNYIKNEAAASDVLVDNDANLIQINNAAVNIGNITVKRSANLKKSDYNYWGSPVVGQNVKAFSSETLDTRFYTYNESNDYFDGLFIKNLYPDNTSSLTPIVSKTTYNFITGKGYAIRASANLTSTTATEIAHQFVGVPYNGVLDIPVLKSGTGSGYNLISNPFPSNVDFNALYNYTYNAGVNKNSDLIYQTAYFWTNTNFNPKMQGVNYPSNLPSGKQIINNYAVLNGTGGVGAPYGFSGTGTNDVVGSTNNCSGCKVPTNIIKVGQGFIVKAKKAGTNNIRFENGASIRTNSSTSNFFNRMSSRASETAIDRYWIALKTPLDFVTPLLVGYVEGASNSYEEDFDAELFILGGDSFYTLLGNKKLGIQGKQFPFNANDVVDLGASFGLQGTYEISLGSKEGVFANGQDIYLRDNATGIVTNLNQGAYRFEASASEVNDRFQILYINTTLDAGSVQSKKGIMVYKENHYAVISSDENLKSVKLYDISGKLLFHKNVSTKDYKIDMSSYKSGVYVVDVLTVNNHFNKKVIK